MTWFNLKWTEKDYRLLEQWHHSVGKNFRYIDESQADPLADEVSWLYGIPIERDVLSPLERMLNNMAPAPKKERKRRKALTERQRNAIFNEIGRRCSLCGKEDDLQIHHINENPEDNSIGNLECLCYRCHKKRHAVRRLQ